MDRKKFLTKGVSGMFGEFLRSPAGNMIDKRLQGLSNLLAPEGLPEPLEEAFVQEETLEEKHQNRGFPRPPGAISDSEAFLKACTQCGDCLIACPEGTLFNLTGDSGPVLDPNFRACALCDGWPCIKSCDTGALKKLGKNTLPEFGLAVLVEENCINHSAQREILRVEGTRLPYCKQCEKACPVEDAVHYDRQKMPVFTDSCVGCGLCITPCPAPARAIEIQW